MKLASRLFLAALLTSGLVLSACSSPVPSSQQSAPPSSETVPSAAETPPGTSSGDDLAGGFASMNEACISVSATFLSISILPLAGLVGGKAEDVKKAQDELAKFQDKVPAELKPDFDKLKAFIDSAGSDFSKYSTGEFEKLSKPIEEWIDKNCK